MICVWMYVCVGRSIKGWTRNMSTLNTTLLLTLELFWGLNKQTKQTNSHKYRCTYRNLWQRSDKLNSFANRQRPNTIGTVCASERKAIPWTRQMNQRYLNWTNSEILSPHSRYIAPPNAGKKGISSECWTLRLKRSPGVGNRVSQFGNPEEKILHQRRTDSQNARSTNAKTSKDKIDPTPRNRSNSELLGHCGMHRKHCYLISMRILDLGTTITLTNIYHRNEPIVIWLGAVSRATRPRHEKRSTAVGKYMCTTVTMMR
jgi:hypothetical protein